MLTSKRSRRKSDVFRSRFLDAGHEAAPLRNARRLREYLAGQVVQGLLQLGFLVAMVYLGRALVHLFERHGADLNPWYLRVCLVGIGVSCLLVARRLLLRIKDILETHRDLRQTQRQLEDLREANRRRD
jgi:hypothetical protein